MVPTNRGPIVRQGRRRGRFQVRPCPLVQTPGPHCGDGLRPFSGAVRRTEGAHVQRPMFPPRAGTSRPPQEPQSDFDVKETEPAATPRHTGREKG